MPTRDVPRDAFGGRGLSLAAAALVGLAGTLAGALAAGVAAPQAGSTFAGLAAIVFVLYHRHGDRPAFGIANAITLLRLGLVGVLAAGLAAGGLGPNAWTPGLLALLALALDGLDGHVARRTGRASAFGARFDVEVDAGLLLAATLLLVAWGKVDALALLLPALRPAFVLAGRAFPWLEHPLPPSGRRKAVGALTGLCVLTALLPPVSPALAAATVGACLAGLIFSFASDAARLWRRRGSASASALEIKRPTSARAKRRHAIAYGRLTVPAGNTAPVPPAGPAFQVRHGRRRLPRLGSCARRTGERADAGCAVLAGLISALRRLNLVVEAAIRPLAWVGMALMLFAVLLTVVARETFLFLPWTDKVALIILPVLAFIVAPVAYRRSENVALDLFLDLLPPRLARAHTLLIHLCLAVVFLIGLDLTLRKIGLRFAPLEVLIETVFRLDVGSIRPFKAPLRIPTIGLEWRYVYMVMPVSFALLLLANLEIVLRTILGLADPDNPAVVGVRTFDEAHAGAHREE